MQTHRRIGPFVLLDRIGQGAMGQVFRAHHPTLDVEVAIKVIATPRAADPRFQASFRREVEAVAALLHPGINALYDFGLVGGSEGLGVAPEGSPWVAMQLATLGSLTQAEPLTRWSDLCRLLLEILDPLGHAHTRGVIHRDLKPANILRVPDSIHGWRCQISDFGLAHPLALAELGATQEIPSRSAGTPAYMAPEQIEGCWRDFGPWTDLYALGCMAFQFAVGRLPFTGQTLPAISRQHIEEPPPPLAPRFPVPPGFAGWVHRLMAKAWSERFPRAAAAAAALRALDAEAPRLIAPLALSEVPSLALAELETLPLGTVLPRTPTTPNTVSASDAPLQAPHLASTPAQAPTFRAPTLHAPTPLPERWQLPADTARPTLLQSVGLGLYGLRQPPLVGRVRERDVLWRTFRQVCAEGVASAVILRGVAGIGKRALARWMTQRLDELHAATILGPIHAERGLHEALAVLLSQLFTTRGLNAARARDRTQQLLLACYGHDDPALAAALTAATGPLLRPPAPPTQPPARWLPALLRLLGQRLPIVLWFEAPTKDPMILEIIETLLSTQDTHPLRALLLLTCDDEDHPPGSPQSEALEALAALPNAPSLPLAALQRSETYELLQSLLIFDHHLLINLEFRSAGHPGVLLSAVDTLIESGALRPGPDGFESVPGALVAFPIDRIDAAWRRVEAVVHTFEPGAREHVTRALEAAAALGVLVVPAELEAVCRLLGLRLEPQLADTMRRHHLWRWDSGWIWGSPIIREAIVQHTHLHGRQPDLQRACAAALIELGSTLPYALRHRVSNHLASAGELVQAVPWLITSAQDSLNVHFFALVEHDLGLLDAILDELQVPAHAVQRAWSIIFRARTLIDRNLVRDATALLAPHAWLLDASAPLPVRSWAGRLHAIAAMRQGHLALAQHHLDALVTVEAELNQSTLQADALKMRAQLQRYAGDHAASLATLEQAQRLLHEGGITLEPTQLSIEIAYTLIELRRYDEAVVLLEHIDRRAAHDDNVMMQALVNIARAVILRRQDQPDQALPLLHQARYTLAWFGSQQTAIVDLNLTFAHLQAARPHEAQEALQRGRPALRREVSPPTLALIHAASAWLHALLGEPARARADLESALDLDPHHATNDDLRRALDATRALLRGEPPPRRDAANIQASTSPDLTAEGPPQHANEFSLTALDHSH